MKKVLFVVNGLGLGNSTRCHAVMQHLYSLGAEVGIITSGNGLWYFEGHPEPSFIESIEALHYGKKDGRLSVAATLASLGSMISTIRRDSRKITRVIDDWKPDLIAVDSNYNVRAVGKSGVPVVALNNSDVVVASYRKFMDKPASIRAQFYLVECMDYLLHKTFMDAALSPSLDPALETVSDSFRRIGPIVRAGYTAKPGRASGKRNKVVVMLSGSTFGTEVRFERTDIPADIEIVGRDAPQGTDTISNVTYHGRVKNTYDITKDADLVVVNGGFSAVSEMFVMKKPMIVVPVPNHAEQWINARTVQALGVGEIGDESDIEDRIVALLARLDVYRRAYGNLPEPRDGAREAAEIIVGMIS